MEKTIKEKYWQEKWNVGVVKCQYTEFFKENFIINSNNISWMFSEKKDKYYADPFLLKYDLDYFVFYEEFDLKQNKGVISYVKIDIKSNNISTSQPQVVIEKDYHLSYPYIFQYDNNIYLMPESAQAKKISLYSASEFPAKWEKTGDILNDIPAFDATLFQHDEYLWLFFIIDKSQYFELYAYYSDNLLSNWQPHKQNPIKQGLRSTRPAGKVFYYDGKLYRPTQNCEDTYGKELNFNRIDKLNPYEFEEKAEKLIRPPKNTIYKHGIHHFSFDGDMCVIDAKRFIFPKKILYPILKYYRRLTK